MASQMHSWEILLVVSTMAPLPIDERWGSCFAFARPPQIRSARSRRFSRRVAMDENWNEVLDPRRAQQVAGDPFDTALDVNRRCLGELVMQDKW